MQCYADVVFNHKDGGDNVERVLAEEIDWHNRNWVRSDKHEIGAYTHFTFPNRAGKYSTFQWFWWCFDCVSYNADTDNTNKLYRLRDKHFETEVSHEHGNYDYLMACDLDSSNPFVRGELQYWGEWLISLSGINGFRIDAVKHIRSSFFGDWLHQLRTKFNQEFFSVGEYWEDNVGLLEKYIRDSGGVMSLFDVPLHYQFHRASKAGRNFDLRAIFEDTLVRAQPFKAVTFVDNHDTQPVQSLQSPVEDWFKPLAYAFTLLRKEGDPCVFYADYYGATYIDEKPNRPPQGPFQSASHSWLIDKFLWARQAYGYGDQHDYFDHHNTVGWVRTGSNEHPGAMAVLLSNGDDGYKWMNVYRPNASFYDHTEHITEKVITNAEGWGKFRCKGGKVSVWLQE